MGAGFVLGGLILGVWGGFKRHIYTAVLGLAVMAMGTLLIGIAPPVAIGWLWQGSASLASSTPSLTVALWQLSKLSLRRRCKGVFLR